MSSGVIRRGRLRVVLMAVFVLLSVLLVGCEKRKAVEVPSEPQSSSVSEGIVEITENKIEPVTETGPKAEKEPVSMLNPDGFTLQERIRIPDGYTRVQAEDGSFQTYMRQLPVKADGSLVLLNDGSEKNNQSAQIAVFELPVFTSDLQQCADSIMRVYAEYFWSKGAYDKIAFHLTNGFMMDYPTWRDGNRLSVNGNNVSWVKKASYDDSYDTFLLYLKYVMMYAGTLSLDEESTPINMEQIKAGDMFIRGGSPGHCVMAADVAVDKDGNYCYLLAQGYMPAQEFHVLKNPLHEEDPWYYVSELEYPVMTPEYVFQEGSFKRWYGMLE